MVKFPEYERLFIKKLKRLREKVLKLMKAFMKINRISRG